MTYPDGENLYYAYDNGGLLNAAWGEKRGNRYNYINSLTYDEFGQRRDIAFGNGVRSSHSYDDKTRRLESLITTTPDTRTVQNMTYGYDLVGNVLKIQNNIATPTNTALPAGPVIQQFDYDDLYQLKTADGEYSFGPGKGNRYKNEFNYDTIGNFTRKSQIHRIIQPSSSEHLPKETNYLLDYKYTGQHPHAVTDAGDKLYSYDNNGNMTGWDNKKNGQRRTITWNEENRIKEIKDNGKSSYYLYDDAGERVLKRGNHGETFYINRFYSIRNGELGTKSIYAGNSRIVSKLVKTPNTVTANTNSTVPGIQGLANGQGKKLGIIRRLNGTTTSSIRPPEEKDQFFYHGDHLGSSNMITDSKGAIYQHLEYFPYGETWIEEGGSYGGNTPGYKFTGKELDPETGLYYFGARYYEPVISRWISSDPILGKYLPTGDKEKDLSGFGGVFNPINLDLYSYGHLNPIKYMDPDGKDVAVPVSYRMSNSGDRPSKPSYAIFKFGVYNYNNPSEMLQAAVLGTLTKPIGEIELTFDARMVPKTGVNKGTILGNKPKWAEMQNRPLLYGTKPKHSISITDEGKGAVDFFTVEGTGAKRTEIRTHWGGPNASTGCATSPCTSYDKNTFENILKEQIPSLNSKDERTYILIPARVEN
jgi:RHS repeat-associated protein